MMMLLMATVSVMTTNRLATAQELNPAQWPNLAGYWKFQDIQDLTKATVGNDLILVGTHEWVPGAYYGDTAIQIAIGSYYKCYHQLPPNGGGDSVNRYALMFDFMVENFNSWHTFQQTDSTNMNDGECFIKPQVPGVKSPIGTATTGYTPDSISPGVWYRMVISVCLDSFYRYYIDGDLWLEGDTQNVDGRFALTPLILFFADNNQEDDTIRIGSLALFDNFLTPAEVALLGNLDPCIAHPPVIDLGPDTILCENQTIALEAGNGFVSWLWSTGDTIQQIILDTALLGMGSTLVYVTAVDMNHCTATDSLVVTFINCTTIDDPATIGPVRAYPNPVNNQCHIEMDREGFSVALYDLSGKKLMEIPVLTKGVHTLDIGDRSPGVYLLRISGSGEDYRIRLVISGNR